VHIQIDAQHDPAGAAPRLALPHLRQPCRIELTEHSFKTMSPLFTGEYAWGAFVRIDADLAQLRASVANLNFVRR
jgi:hypothetical protein